MSAMAAMHQISVLGDDDQTFDYTATSSDYWRGIFDNYGVRFGFEPASNLDISFGEAKQVLQGFQDASINHQTMYDEETKALIMLVPKPGRLPQPYAYCTMSDTKIGIIDKEPINVS